MATFRARRPHRVGGSGIGEGLLQLSRALDVRAERKRLAEDRARQLRLAELREQRAAAEAKRAQIRFDQEQEARLEQKTIGSIQEEFGLEIETASLAIDIGVEKGTYTPEQGAVLRQHLPQRFLPKMEELGFTREDSLAYFDSDEVKKRRFDRVDRQVKQIRSLPIAAAKFEREQKEWRQADDDRRERKRKADEKHAADMAEEERKEAEARLKAEKTAQAEFDELHVAQATVTAHRELRVFLANSPNATSAEYSEAVDKIAEGKKDTLHEKGVSPLGIANAVKTFTAGAKKDFDELRKADVKQHQAETAKTLAIAKSDGRRDFKAALSAATSIEDFDEVNGILKQLRDSSAGYSPAEVEEDLGSVARNLLTRSKNLPADREMIKDGTHPVFSQEVFRGRERLVWEAYDAVIKEKATVTDANRGNLALQKDQEAERQLQFGYWISQQLLSGASVDATYDQARRLGASDGTIKQAEETRVYLQTQDTERVNARFRDDPEAVALVAELRDAAMMGGSLDAIRTELFAHLRLETIGPEQFKDTMVVLVNEADRRAKLVSEPAGKLYEAIWKDVAEPILGVEDPSDHRNAAPAVFADKNVWGLAVRNRTAMIGLTNWTVNEVAKATRGAYEPNGGMQEAALLILRTEFQLLAPRLYGEGAGDGGREDESVWVPRAQNERQAARDGIETHTKPFVLKFLSAYASGEAMRPDRFLSEAILFERQSEVMAYDSDGQIDFVETRRRVEEEAFAGQPELAADVLLQIRVLDEVTRKLAERRDKLEPKVRSK